MADTICSGGNDADEDMKTLASPAYVLPLDRNNNGAKAAEPRVNVLELMRGSRELVLDHGGQLYRLRITALGKLILTK